MTHLKALLAGFVATLLFHQGVLAILHGAGATTRKPWVMAPTNPLGVPSVVSLAFWGGLWGILLWRMIRGVSGVRHWFLAVLLGALLPTVVALFVVLPLKGHPVGGGWKPDVLLGALLLNGAWGIGVALLMRLLGR